MLRSVRRHIGASSTKTKRLAHANKN